MTGGDPKPGLQAWATLVEKETRGRAPSDLAWRTPEGIEVKPLYTAADLEGLAHLDSLPGFAPFVRGPRASMYAGRPWTLGQYAGFSTAATSSRARGAFPSRSTSPPTGAQTPTARGLPAMSARRGWRSIRSRT